MIWHIFSSSHTMICSKRHGILLLTCQLQEWNCSATQNFLKISRSSTFWNGRSRYGVNTFWLISDELAYKKYVAQCSIQLLPLGMAFRAPHRGHRCSYCNSQQTHSEFWKFSFCLGKSLLHPTFWSCSASQIHHQKLRRFKYIMFPGIIAMVQYSLQPIHHNFPKCIYEDLKINYFSFRDDNYTKSLSNQSPLFRYLNISSLLVFNHSGLEILVCTIRTDTKNT